MKHRRVDPAHAGMILLWVDLDVQGFSGPRACGDDPLLVVRKVYRTLWTPRMRG